MNTDRTLSAVLAVVVVLAVGLSASTLASSMSTDPSDAVDVGDVLPLSDDSDGAVMAAAQGIHDQYNGQGESEDGPDGQSRAGGAGEGPEQEVERPDESDERTEAAGADEAQSDPSGAGDGVPVEAWPRWLVALAAVLLAVVTAAYYRYRVADGGDGGESAPGALTPAPENEVERAWAELVTRAGVPQPRTRTPRDCARRAVETGYDPEVVDRLRRAFEDVRYGAGAPTDEQTRVARRTLSHLEGERA